MLSGKFLFTLIGIVMAILAICNYDFSAHPVVENWNMGAQTVTAMPYVVGANGNKTAFSGNFFDPASLRGSGKFVSVPSYQAVLSPRFSNVQYGANIRYNMPDRENLAAPCNPLTFGDMAKENYAPRPQQQQPVQENYSCGTGQCGSSDGQSCGKGGYGLGHKIGSGYELPVGYTNGNYMDQYNSLTDSGAPAKVVSQPCSDSSASSSLPVGTMSTMDALGNPEQFVVMNRLMNVNMNSKLRGLGDPIRGDLAITPCQSGWFSVYPTINVDLQPGAMNVLGGHQVGESNSKLMELLINASGGSRTTFGGVDFSDAPAVNMTPQYGAVLGAASTDVQVTAFP
jgi:hypothetical protein